MALTVATDEPACVGTDTSAYSGPEKMVSLRPTGDGGWWAVAEDHRLRLPFAVCAGDPLAAACELARLLVGVIAAEPPSRMRAVAEDDG